MPERLRLREEVVPKKKKKYLKHTVKARDSGIHGKGLFATVPIANGAVIGFCKAQPTSISGPYTLSTDEGDMLVTCRLRFINHSPQPNVVYYDDLSVVALRDILPGDELTHDYGADWSREAS